MLTLLIPGPKQPGNDIDIFLQPLIDDLKLLWDGVEVYNVVSKSNFNLRVVLMWTINDFPAYGNLAVLMWKTIIGAYSYSYSYSNHKFYTDGLPMIHLFLSTMYLLANAVHVWVDTVKIPNSFLWRPTSDIIVIDDALSTTVAWPMDKVKLFKDFET
ncbi:uncharacterized protein E5676_scaffold186G001590 [Cucumis melo var. makuwa]|uniref:Uncharacterized protein n=1 Tax=Cucumis melo var. makuwa TaxID=1194695 RepID=A0A5D3CW49_CUCMM|nr:uncharacterized protein E6C27_scaffold1184G00020 [Cucumis melo var. makuwa]TYK14489.1 uncharacterized protein E5676_scaffold186G001590 [Cucumis melo var. makuwa]